MPKSRKNKCSNPTLNNVGRVYACYYCCMPSSPVLLHTYLVLGYTSYYCCMPSSPSCVAAYILSFGLHMLHALILCVAAYINNFTCFSTFWHCHPYILQHFNENVYIHPSLKADEKTRRALHAAQ